MKGGYDNASTGLCRNHGERGGQEGNQNATDNPGCGPPESNDNAVTHGAFRENFLDHMTDEEADRVATAEELLSTPEGSQELARMMAAVALEQFRRSGNERFLAEFRRICEKARIFPTEETDHNHRHAHKHDYDHDRELTDRQLSALDSIGGGSETIEVETAESPDWSEDAGDTKDTEDTADAGDADSDALKIGW